MYLTIGAILLILAVNVPQPLPLNCLLVVLVQVYTTVYTYIWCTSNTGIVYK